jgi:hypothetical protein
VNAVFGLFDVAHRALPEPRLVVDHFDVIAIEQLLASFASELARHVPLEMNVDSAVVFSPLVGFVNRVDAVDVANAQIAERLEYCALCLVSANCPESPGNTYTWVAFVTARFFATVITTILTTIIAAIITARFFTARFFTTTVIMIVARNVFTAVTVIR